jgi:outer membrane protein assembly factor BamB
LEPKTLTVKDWFTDSKANFTSTPTIFKVGDKELLAAATADGRIYVLGTASLGGSDHKSPVSVSTAFSSTKTDFAPKSLASWQDADGSTYIAEPFAGAGPSGAPSNGAVTNGGVVALKVSDTGSLSPAWVSGDMTSPLTPLIVNSVMFTASKSPTAVLFAIDASTGKQLWSSGKTITSPAAVVPLWLGAGQIYIATSDNTVYAFGFAEERYPVGQ